MKIVKKQCNCHAIKAMRKLEVKNHHHDIIL